MKSGFASFVLQSVVVGTVLSVVVVTVVVVVAVVVNNVVGVKEGLRCDPWLTKIQTLNFEILCVRTVGDTWSPSRA